MLHGLVQDGSSQNTTAPLDGPTLSARGRERGVLVNAMGARTLRAVTHLDVSRAQCEAAALADVEAATDWYVDEAGADVAARFVVALEGAYEHIARHPTGGSPRWGGELNVPALRAWPLTRYPYLVFYVEQAQHVEVWRVLHGARDLPATLAEPETPAR